MLGVWRTGLWGEIGLTSSFSRFSYPIINLNFKLNQYVEACWKWFNRDFERYACNELLEKIEALQAENIALLASARYWQENHEAIHFAQRYNLQKAVLAQIFFKDLRPQSLFFLLNKGKNHGIEEGMVAAWKNLLVGKVVTVYPNYSQVALLPNRICKVAVYSEKHGAGGICCGKGDLNQLDLKYVSHLQRLCPGERLISSGEGETFPQGFGVGTVTNVELEGMYYNCTVTPLVDFELLKYCYLIASNEVGAQFANSGIDDTVKAEVAL